MIQAVSVPSATQQWGQQLPTLCHVVHALGVGGAEVLVQQLVLRLATDYRSVVAVLDDVGQLGEQLRAAGIPVFHLHRRPGIDLKCAERLRAFADAHQADLLHAHQCTPFFHAMLSRGCFGRRPVVFTEHGRHVPDLPSRRSAFVNRLLLRRQDRLIACGQAVRQALICNEGLPAERVEVIYNGVDIDALSHPTADAGTRIREQLGFAATDYVIIIVARLHALKDHQTALRAFERVRGSMANARLLIVGDGEERTPIQQTIAQNGLSSDVILTGTRNDIAELLSAADTFLLTSISEGIPLTVIEAMAVQRPVVATAVGGLKEMISPGITGFLAERGDDQTLAVHLTTLGQQPELRRQLGQRAAEEAKARFCLHQMLLRYRCVYKEVLNGVRR